MRESENYAQANQVDGYSSCSGNNGRVSREAPPGDVGPLSTGGGGVVGVDNRVEMLCTNTLVN